MAKLLIEKYSRIVQNKTKLEKKLKVKIQNRGREIYFAGTPGDEFVAEKVFEALDFGFPFKIALMIKEEDYEFHKISIKKYTRRHDLKTVKGRIIGAKGKTLRTLNELTKCFFEIKENEVGIIGYSEHIKNAKNALVSIIQGTRQANVYAYLEHHRYEEPLDLGLKEVKKK